MERISEVRMMSLEPVVLPPWCIDKLPKPLRAAVDKWNAALPAVDRQSRTAVLRARVELQVLLTELVGLARQWSEEACAVVLSRKAEEREILLPRGAVDPATERLYDQSLERRVRSAPLVRIAVDHENDCRRLLSDLGGASALNSACVRQMDGSGVDRREPAVLKVGV